MSSLVFFGKHFMLSFKHLRNLTPIIRSNTCTNPVAPRLRLEILKRKISSGRDGDYELFDVGLEFDIDSMRIESILATIFKAGPSLMLIADIKWSSFNSISACPSIS